DWGSPKPTSSSRVQFAPKTRRRNFIPDEQDLQSRRQLIRQIDHKIKRRNARRWKIDFKPTVLATIIEDPAEEDLSDIESSLDTGFIDGEVDPEIIAIALKNHRQMLPTVLHDMLSNIPIPMDLDDDDDNNDEPCMEEQAPLSLKRTATSCLISSRPTKRRKMNSSSTVPTCAATWAKRTNELFTPLLPVIIEDPEEDGDESHIDSSLDAGFNDDIANQRSTQLAKADAIWVKKAEEILGEKANLNKMTKTERAKWAKKARARNSKGQKEEMSEKEIDFEPTLLVIIEDPKKEEEEVDDVNEKKEFKPSLHVIIEDPEGEDLSTIDESPLDAGLINDDFDSLEDGSDGEIFAAPTEQSDNAATNDIPSDEMGSGWTESGKRYSRRLQLKLSPDKKDPSTEALGSGMTEKGRRYSRRVVNRGKGAN
ncbi:unnamed protein product, partial [Cylindrotheca closterium]